jgi:hypothetical protein
MPIDAIDEIAPETPLPEAVVLLLPLPLPLPVPVPPVLARGMGATLGAGPVATAS